MSRKRVKMVFRGKELGLEAEDRLEQLKRHLGLKAIILQGRRPSGLKVAMIDILARERGLPITRRQMSEKYGITTQLIWKNTKLLKQLIHNPAMKRDGQGSEQDV